jgi:ribosome maturation factor RimP
MQVQELINQTIQDILAERGDLFVVKQHITSNLDINLILDGDELVNIKDCIDISRRIENTLDREEYDFSIKVQSPGADEPLLLPRQYKKHVGRKIRVETAEDTFEGNLVEVDENAIHLSWKARERKPKGKGKITVKYERTIPFKAIEKANIKLTFNTN